MAGSVLEAGPDYPVTSMSIYSVSAPDHRIDLALTGLLSNLLYQPSYESSSPAVWEPSQSLRSQLSRPQGRFPRSRTYTSTTWSDCSPKPRGCGGQYRGRTSRYWDLQPMAAQDDVSRNIQGTLATLGPICDDLDPQRFARVCIFHTALFASAPPG